MTLGRPHGINHVHPLYPLGVHPSPQSVQRVYTLSPLGIHPSPLRVISENPSLCHSLSLEGQPFPFSKECLHEAANINKNNSFVYYIVLGKLKGCEWFVEHLCHTYSKVCNIVCHIYMIIKVFFFHFVFC